MKNRVRTLRCVLLCVAAGFVAACSSGAGNVQTASGQNSDPATIDFPIFYVKRYSDPTQAQAPAIVHQLVSACAGGRAGTTDLKLNGAVPPERVAVPLRSIALPFGAADAAQLEGLAALVDSVNVPAKSMCSVEIPIRRMGRNVAGLVPGSSSRTRAR